MKTNKMRNAIAVKAHDRITISLIDILIPVNIISRQPPVIIKIVKIKSRII
jgi:hypothetical protein